MANIKSAKKRAKQTEKRTLVNVARKSAIKSASKSVADAIGQQADAATLKALLADAEGQIARSKSKRKMHRNTASRKISRLAKKVAAALRSQKTASK
jgi:small subunit ribosomal protein S20